MLREELAAVAAVVAPAVPHRVAAAVLQPAGVALRLAVAAAGWRLGGAAGAVHRQWALRPPAG